MEKDKTLSDQIAQIQPAPTAVETENAGQVSKPADIEEATASIDEPIESSEQVKEQEVDSDKYAITENELHLQKQEWLSGYEFGHSRQGAVNLVKYGLLLMLLAFLRAFTTHVFIIPNQFAPGGIGGISSIIYNAVEIAAPGVLDNPVFNLLLDAGLTTFIMNIPILVAAFFRLNKKFAINTFFVIAFYSAFMMMLSAVHCPQYKAPEGDTGTKIIAALVGGVITGFCLGMMLRTNMSMGGTDIIGKFIHKHNPSAGAQWWILMCDCTVVLMSGILGVLELRGQKDITATSALTAVLSPILFSFLSLVVCSLTADFIQSGFQTSLVFNIVTDKPDEIGKKISDVLHRGVTITRAIGYYTGIEHEVLTCVVSKKQIAIVKNIIHSIDPKAFTYITKASEVAGKGFHRSPDEKEGTN